MEDKTICFSQHLDIIYSHSCTLHDTILNSLRLSINRSHLKVGLHVDGEAGSTSFSTIGHMNGNIGQMTITNNQFPIAPITNPTPATTHTSKVNTVQTASSKNTW